MTGDLISREALKKRLQEHKDFFIKSYGGRHNFITNAPQDIKVRVDELNNSIAEVVNAPTVEERQQGEWIKYSFKDFGAFGDYDYKCSNCEKVSGGKYNFCSNCGADMRGGKTNDRK